jgi:uracil-DNA glycosylase
MSTAAARLNEARKAAASCRACELWRVGTQTVFGEGRCPTSLMLVGEQPGDSEDRTGRPFVGPAGRLLEAILEEAGVERDEVYLTNTVKHFRWHMGRGTRRIHDKPGRKHVMACATWLETEIEHVSPIVLVCLGSTAAQAIIGKEFKVTTGRGEFVQTRLSGATIATLHPSAILRAKGEERTRLRDVLVADLSRAAEAARSVSGAVGRG